MAELTLSHEHDGARFDVRVGDTITIRLSESSAAGYRWIVSSLDERRIALVNQSHEADERRIGSAGTAVWKLVVKQAGPTRVEMQKSRPWERDDSVAERFSITLDVVG